MVCAEIQVPVVWAKPTGRTLTLRLGRLPATGGRAEGSVLVAYGGPGGPGISITRSRAARWAGLRRRMDIVTWDTRGYGEQFGGTSTGLECTWTATPYPRFPRDDAEFGSLADTNRGYAEACRPRDPELFANMSSADNARDMEAIRAALGEPKLNVYGASYAGFYAQSYARLFPDRVRTMVLDGTSSHSFSPSEAGWNRELNANARRNEAAMRRFFTWCTADASCALHGRNVARLWRNLLTRADRSPIPTGTPATGPAGTATAGPAGTAAGTGGGAYVAYDGRDLRWWGLGLAREGLNGSSGGWPALARAIARADRGDASGFVPEEGGARYPALTTPVTECLDWPQFRSRVQMAKVIDRLRKIAPHTGAAHTLAIGTLACVGWPVPVTDPPRPLPAGLPPLLGAGAWVESDAVERVLRQVPGSGSIRHDGPGHTLYLSNDCARAAIDRYFTDLTVPAPGTEC